MSKVIFLDIDGTLLDHDRYLSIPYSANEAVKRAQYNGHKIVICTGRTKSNVHPKLLRFKPDASIYAAGCTVELNDQTLFNVSIPTCDLKAILQDMDAYHFGYTLEGEFDSYRDPVAVERMKRIHGKKDLDSFHQMILSSEDTHFEMSDCDPDQVVMNKITVIAENEDDLNAFMKKYEAGYDFVIHDRDVENQQTIVEMLIKGISKAKGMDIMLEALGADIKDTIAFGDSMNDYEMIMHAHIGVCMGNGSARLKAVADRVCEKASEDGIYKEFERLGLI